MVSEVVRLPGARLTLEERKLIVSCRQDGLSVRQTAKVLDRAPSTISREVRRNFCLAGVPGYRAFVAHHRATERARRPKAFKLGRHPRLARRVERWLEKGWSPEQIAARLRKDHPHDPRWWVSHEAIYRALYVQGRGGLRKELTSHLRRGRARRRTGPERKGRFHDMVMLAERPPEADDRAVPGHWEGDLLLGAGCRSQVGMLTERTTRLTLLFALPHDRTAASVSAALAEIIQTLPSHLVRSLTWDQGKEMARHAQFTIDTGVEVYFCDPGAPWQRGTAENTVGLLRQYLSKTADLSKFSSSDLTKIARQLNGRPRKTLDWETPAEAYARLVSVATAD
jgi:transposase, IS30 family